MIGIGTAVGGRYEVVGHAGRGGMADVFVAHDERLGRRVAVKAFRGTDDADRRRFDTEARVLAGLDHPGLVRVLDAGEHEGTPFLVLELIDGPSLSELLDGAPPLDGQQTREIALELGAALAYVHARGVVHRDVKPSNILFDEHGRARLADFGIARLADSSHLTAPATSMGTAAYMAPEQVEGGDVGPPADVYALGLVLLECLTGQRSFDGPPQEAAFARLTRDPQIPDTIPPAWQGLLGAMTARDPAARPGAADLDQPPATPTGDATIPLDAPVAATSTLPVRPVAAVAAVAAADRPRARRGGRVAAAALVGLVGAAVVWGLLLSLGDSNGTGPVAAVATSTIPATVPTTVPPTTTTTLPSCETIDSVLDLLDEQKKDLGKRFKGDKERKERAKAALEDQQDAAKAQQDACEDAEQGDG